MNDSGWYLPTLNDVMSRKLQRPLKYLKYGLILFQHQLIKNKVYAQKYKETDDNILNIISCLFTKQDEELNHLELEIKYTSPKADSWYVSAKPVPTLDDTDLLLARPG